MNPRAPAVAESPLPGPVVAAQWRLGFATRLLGAPLRPHDSRRWAQQPHLSVSLAYLRDILGYLAELRIHFYRLSSSLAPYATHPALPAFHRQIDECRLELAMIGDLARAARIRLTMHPGPWVRLDSEDAGQAARAAAELRHAADLFEAMGLDEESVLVVHAEACASGSGRVVAGDGCAGAEPPSTARLARRIEALPPSVRRRLTIENGDRAGPLDACLWLHRRTGLPVVLDVLHHRCLNPGRLPLEEALALALATWPAGQLPKIHLSSPRTELRQLRRGGRTYLAAPLPSQHSDFINPFEAIEVLRLAQRRALRPFDILLEAKAHDLALLRLREQIALYAPEVARALG